MKVLLPIRPAKNPLAVAVVAAPRRMSQLPVRRTALLRSPTLPPRLGDKVTVTLTPSTGYEADTHTIKDKSGATITATKNADGTYTFTMPEASKLPVSVSATFKKAAEATGFIDVAADADYADAVKWAVGHDPQITNGKNAADTFLPKDGCTRAEIVTFLYRDFVK